MVRSELKLNFQRYYTRYVIQYGTQDVTAAASFAYSELPFISFGSLLLLLNKAWSTTHTFLLDCERAFLHY